MHNNKQKNEREIEKQRKGGREKQRKGGREKHTKERENNKETKGD